MKFYKLTAQVGHAGSGSVSDMCVYVYAENVTDALKQLHNMPMVKKLSALPLTKAEIVTEDEFFRGTIYNPYFDFVKSEEVDEIASLEKLAGRLWYLFECGHKIKAETGKILKDYCDKYIRAGKKQQKRINQEYLIWAESLVDESNI